MDLIRSHSIIFHYKFLILSTQIVGNVAYGKTLVISILNTRNFAGKFHFLALQTLVRIIVIISA